MNEKVNDKISDLKGIDLLDLLQYIESYDLEYRDTLNLEDEVTIGIEIEYERMIKFLIDRFIKNNFEDWRSITDESLQLGGEINSPIIHDEPYRWEELKKICKYLKKRRVITGCNAGGHIHIGSQVLGTNHNNWRKFAKTYAVYEDILFRFFYGDKILGRKSLYCYAPPIADRILDKIEDLNSAKDLQELRVHLPVASRYQAINFTNVRFDLMDEGVRYKNTIELRCPNSTVEEVIWQNNINAIAKILTAVTKPNFDEEYLDYKIANGEAASVYEYHTYNEVLLKKVLEFTDLIFDNNKDKIYFLRQYIKDFQETETNYLAFNAKKFTK